MYVQLHIFSFNPRRCTAFSITLTSDRCNITRDSWRLTNSTEHSWHSTGELLWPTHRYGATLAHSTRQTPNAANSFRELRTSIGLSVGAFENHRGQDPAQRSVLAQIGWGDTGRWSPHVPSEAGWLNQQLLEILRLVLGLSGSPNKG